MCKIALLYCNPIVITRLGIVMHLRTVKNTLEIATICTKETKYALNNSKILTPIMKTV
jgi:hypothetical protein